MSLQNASVRITELIITGFETTNNPLLLGVVILITFLVAVSANLLNIVIIIYNKDLHKPMYLLICNLAVVDILYTSSVCPTMITVLVSGDKSISYVPCLIQMFSFHLAGMMEAFALTVMAFDRFVAVGFPFQYNRHFTNARVALLTYILWIGACGFAAVLPVTVIPLPHCQSALRYTFCNYPAVVRTTCVDPEYYFNMAAITIFFITFFTFTLICLSYLGIICFVKLSSNNDKKRMGTTCLSHLIVVICYYVPVFILAVLTRLGVVLTLAARNGLNIGTILGPCLVNPFVYCLRTKAIKNKFVKMFKTA